MSETNVAMTTPFGTLTDEQKAFYDREGYLVIEPLLTDAEMAPAREAMTETVDEMAADMVRDGLITDPMTDAPFRYRLARLFAPFGNQEFLKYGFRSFRDRKPGYFNLMSNPKILDAVESLIGPEIFANPVYNTRPKVPKVAAGAVPWHQDKSYWPGTTAYPVITVWIPLVDSTLENGCLHIIPRTHRHRVLEFGSDQQTGVSFHEIGQETIQRESKKRSILAVPVRAGGAILFNDRLLHMSSPNQSDHVRWSVDLRYQSTDQDRMPQYGAGFLARSWQHPERVATLDDWLANRPEHIE